jgi:hypothetical protein
MDFIELDNIKVFRICVNSAPDANICIQLNKGNVPDKM